LLHHFKPLIMKHIKSNRKTAAGILLFVFGALLLVQNLNLLNIPVADYLLSWQSIIIFIGIFVIAANPHRKAGYIMVFAGTVFMLSKLLNIETHLIIWPALLIGAGVLTLFKNRFRCNRPVNQHAFIHCKGEEANIRISKRED